MAKSVSFAARLKGVPDSSTVPDNGYILEIHKVEPSTTKTGKKSYKAQLKVVEGKYKGAMLFENFTIGNDEDPEAEEPDTWNASMGAKQFKQMVEKSGVDLDDDADEEDVCNALKGARVYAIVTEVTQTEGEYKGMTSNRVARNGWYGADEKHPESAGGGGKEKAKVKSKPAPKIEEEEEDDEPAPKPKTKAKSKPAPVEEEDEDDDEEEDEEEVKPKKGKAKPPVDDDEEDDDEEEEPAPKKKRR